MTRSIFFSLSCVLFGAGVVVSCSSDSGTDKSSNACGAGQANAGAAGSTNGGAPSGGTTNGGTAGAANAGSAVGGAPAPPTGGTSGAAAGAPTEAGSAGEANTLNECGGRSLLVGSKGDACGACGHLVCAADQESLLCDAGVPNWIGTTGVVVPELNDPRWAPAPKTAFDNDLVGQAGFYRVLLDPVANELDVSFQVPTDPDVPSAADAIYFAFTADGTSATLAKGVVIQVNGQGTTDPSPAAIITNETFNAAVGWSALSGAPAWLQDAAVWRNNLAGDAAWGINFKVDLPASGISPTLPFKVFLGLHKQNELAPATSIDLSTPGAGANALLANTLFIADPRKWAIAIATSSTCAVAVSIVGTY